MKYVEYLAVYCNYICSSRFSFSILSLFTLTLAQRMHQVCTIRLKSFTASTTTVRLKYSD